MNMRVVKCRWYMKIGAYIGTNGVYKSLRGHFSSRHGGGVLIAVNNSIISTDATITTSTEITWVKIDCKNHRDIYIAVVQKMLVELVCYETTMLCK